MLSPYYNKLGNKEKVKRLINKGLFDKHIEELSKALYTKRTFTKDIKCYFENISNNKIDNLSSERKTDIEAITKRKNKYNKNNNEKKFHGISFDKNTSKEDRFNKEMRKLLELLNNSQNETNKRFQEINKENNTLNSLYKIYTNFMNKKTNNKNDNNISIFLYDLLIKYKANKNLSFELNSLFSDILKETPLATKDLEKLKFYYIINGEKYNNIKKYNDKLMNKKETKINRIFSMKNFQTANNSFNKIQIPKEPTIIDMTKLKYLKEINYLNKLNRVTRNKIVFDKKAFVKNHRTFMNLNLSLNEKKDKCMEETIGKKLDESYNETRENVNNDDSKEGEQDINNKSSQLNFDIQKDINDINVLKQTIRDSLFSVDEKYNSLLKTSQSMIDNNINTLKSSEKTKNSLNIKIKPNKDIKRKISDKIFPINIENNNNILYEKRSVLRPIINRSQIRKNTSFERFDREIKDIFNRINHGSNNNSFFSNKNVFQGSTFYSNQSINNFNNNSNLSKISLNNSINISNKFNMSPKKTVRISDAVAIPSNNNDNNKKLHKKKFYKVFRKSRTIIEEDENKNYILRDNIKLKMSSEKAYHMAKKINMRNREQSLNKIKDYLKEKNSKLPLLFKGNKLKDTFLFLRRIRNEVKNNDVIYKFKHLKKMLNDNERNKIEDIDLLESNIINKDKELLIKAFKNNF